MGLENLKSAFVNISNKSRIGGRHGGLTEETPSQPPHPVKHSILDNINPYTNQFVYGYEYKNPNKEYTQNEHYLSALIHSSDQWHKRQKATKGEQFF